MVRCNRRNAAPIVQSAFNQVRGTSGRQVGRCLDRHFRSENQPGNSDRPLKVREVRLRRSRHFGARLGAEILDDNLLQMTVALVQVTQCEQAVDPFTARFADADQDAAGEWNLLPPGFVYRRQPHGRILVGGPVVAAAGFTQARRYALQHDAHRHRDLAQGGDFFSRHDAGVEMGKQTGFPKDQPAIASR